MQLFYSDSVSENSIVLKEEEAKHLFVLRKQVNDTIWITDGKGHLFETEIIEIGKKEISLKIIHKTVPEKEKKPFVHLFIAPTKQNERIEWMLEKLIEIGLNEISFIETKNSERCHQKINRLEKIAISAMKQSLQFQLTKINTIISFSDAVLNCKENIQLIGYCGQEHFKTLKEIEFTNENSIAIFIGPEGDFTKEEIEMAKNKKFLPISMGKNRLRTETAGLMAATFFKY